MEQEKAESIELILKELSGPINKRTNILMNMCASVMNEPVEKEFEYMKKKFVEIDVKYIAFKLLKKGETLDDIKKKVLQVLESGKSPMCLYLEMNMEILRWR